MYIEHELPKVHQIIKKYNVVLESLFASAFMTLFSNLVSLEHSSRLIDRFILCKLVTIILIVGQNSIMDIMKNILKQKEKEFTTMDCWDVQVYLGRKIYEQCINDNTFYPPLNSH